MDSLTLQGVSTITIDGALTSGEFSLIDYNGSALPDEGHLVLAATTQDGLPMMLEYDAANTSIDLLVGSASVPEPGCIVTGLLLCLALSRRRNRIVIRTVAACSVWTLAGRCSIQQTSSS